MTVRVRFAPSPTGTLHLGTARSALFNWLYARHTGGVYVLRIEDTDRERSTQENVEQALRMFRWMGLGWDEGPEVGGPHEPYFQSQRGERYSEVLHTLLESGNAYRCFCTKEQLDADRDAARGDNRAFVYTGRCRSLSRDEQRRRASDGEAHVVRFQVPDTGSTIVHDLVLGPTEFDNALIGDFVIARADGSPLYNFANVVDDTDMQITHVIRGSDHLSNTPRQILLYTALEFAVPEFAHVPMILGPDGAKLSKRRHHTATIEQFAEQGYLPSAVRNGLALLGWARDESSTVMTTDELVDAFDVVRVRKSPATVDYDKLRAINGKHLRAATVEEFASAFDSWRREWMADDAPNAVAARQVDPLQAAELVQEKVDVLSDVPPLVSFLVEPFGIEDDAWERLSSSEDAVRALDATRTVLADLDEFSVESVEAALRGVCEALERKPRHVFGPIRIAITGKTVSPGLFESIVAIGRERALQRVVDAHARLEVTSAST